LVNAEWPSSGADSAIETRKPGEWQMDRTFRDDSWIERAVTEELEWAPHVDADDMRISVHEGVVHLTGTVRTLVEKKAAERTVWHIDGVRGIIDDLQVRRPAAHLHSDGEIARRAANVLDWDAQIPGADISVQVEDGKVTLFGAVDWHYQRVEAEACVQRLAGVRAVDNRIIVRSAPATNAEVRAGVLRALRRHPELDASAVAVAVDNGGVTLSGHVPGFGQRRIAENAAWSVRGVNEVIDRLHVGAASEPATR
jgi:osmotically-inducible protein OsmY